MKLKITTTSVKKLLANDFDGDRVLTDDEIKGFQAKLEKSGNVTFALRFSVNGQRREKPLGRFGNVTVARARQLAQINAGKAAGGTDVVKEDRAQRRLTGKTVNAVLDMFETIYLGKKQVGQEDGQPIFSYNVKSAKQYVRCFARDVRPSIGKLNIYDVKRSDVASMVQAITIKRNAPAMAEHARTFTAVAFNWFVTEDDDFVNPIAGGRRGIKGGRRPRKARNRALDEQEIRDVWQALDECQGQGAMPASFAGMVRTLLLTASRLRMVTHMHRDEIDGRDWTIPAERMKSGQEFLVVLPDAVLDLIRSRNTTPHVFSAGDGSKGLGGLSKPKRTLDAKIAEIRKREKRDPMKRWVLHDLRRTARGLMKRGGVDPDTCERVLAHAIPGIRGVYDVEDYRPEKAHALKVLAEQVNRIVRGKNAKVVEFRRVS
jgi:integrase